MIYTVNNEGGYSSVLELLDTIGNSAPPPTQTILKVSSYIEGSTYIYFVKALKSISIDQQQNLALFF